MIHALRYGAQFTLADVLIADTLDGARSAQWALHHPALEDYRDRMTRRPALIRALERESVATGFSRRPN